MTQEIAINTYNNLLQELQSHIANTQNNIAKIIARKKVEMAWLVGKSIEEHLLKNGEASYGENLFKELERDIGITQSALYKMRNFYKLYPALPDVDTMLSWSHYRVLITVKETGQRQHLEDLVKENAWNVAQLQQEAAAKKASNPTTTITQQEIPKLNPKRGQLFSYILTHLDSDDFYIDCGFNVFEKLESRYIDKGLQKALKQQGDQTVQSVKNNQHYSFHAFAIASNALHIYKARLERVVDGDTLRVVLDLGFNNFHRQILRLAKINAPEIKSVEGKKSAASLKEILKNAPFLIIKTTKIDIYGRYIADVFLPDEKGLMTPQQVADEGVHLNQILLDKGVAAPFM